MDVEQDNRAQVLSELLHAKGWHRVLPVPAIDLLTAVIDEGSHVRGAIDARLRRSPDSPAGLSTLIRLSGSRSRQHTLAELLDLLTAANLVVVDQCGEYDVNAEAPHLLDPSSGRLLELLLSTAEDGASEVGDGFNA